MRVALTGTPGTGKTTIADRLETDLDTVHLNDAIREEDLTESVDEERDSLVADLGAVEAWLDDYEAEHGDLLVESHLAHLFDADRVVVLRCDPSELERRLADRGESEAKARENAESEALDVVLSEAVERHGEERVYEVVTTDRDPDAVARDVEAVIAGEREPSAGTVDYTDWLMGGRE
ncbi:adenylate kinase family protein [Salinirubellus sp. GCM10025818]|uniref:adenylate kinase family protein n=1 Tax=Salinirubellus TaxID=2162630 RepID=UPI0030D2993B